MNHPLTRNMTRGESCAVYVGRSVSYGAANVHSLGYGLGNPFIIGRDGNRDQVIAKYRAWLTAQPALMDQVRRLRGFSLGCHCAPRACHADVIAELANQ